MKGKLFENDIEISEKILLTRNPIEGDEITYLDKSYIIKKVILCEDYIRLNVIAKPLPQKIIW